MHYLSEADILRIHEKAIEAHGGIHGLRSPGALNSAVEQPRATFGGEDLYPSIFSKAATLGYGIVRNHPFIDGNKRTGFLAMWLFLHLNGYRLVVNPDDGEDFILKLADGKVQREELANWLRDHADDISG